MPPNKTTLEEANLPLPIRAGVSLATRVDRMGLKIVDLSLDALKARAEKLAGSTAWNDPQFLADINTFLGFVEKSGDLSVTAKVATRADITRRLTNSLKLQEAKKRHPDLTEQPIKAPIVIVGLPRTGTTLLQRLLSQDPATHGPALWELFDPVQMDAPGDPELRRREASSFEKTLRQFSTVLWSIHPMMTDEADECTFIMAQSTGDINLTGGMPYFEWYMKRSAIPDYQLHKQYLQALHYGKPSRRYILKSPHHTPKVGDLLTVYPDANVILCHRGLTHVMASWLSFMALARKIAGMPVDPKQIGRDWVEVLKTSIEAAMKVRDQHAPTQFFDVNYDDLVLDPMGMVRKIYAHFGIELTVAAEVKMKSWLEKDRQQERLGHRYTLAQYGLTPEDLERAFADYIHRYNVPVD